MPADHLRSATIASLPQPPARTQGSSGELPRSHAGQTGSSGRVGSLVHCADDEHQTVYAFAEEDQEKSYLFSQRLDSGGRGKGGREE